MKNKIYFLLFAVITLILFNFSANAEFLCQAEVQYKWRKETKEQPVAVDPKQPQAAETPIGTPELSVFWTNLEQKGSNEEEAKAALNKRVLSERAAAERACLGAHENLTGCISSKYAALTSSISTLGFSARKSIEDAISADCEKQQGKCNGSNVSEVKCSESAEAAKATEPPAKDAKGKKK